ncbi:cytochrome P450 2J4-like [Amphiura filiformis]|uniref:cytochrome P450 2J4-like n=1 Tax=Amphiura filiformis TaxID=82378 RepID=UPI003B21615E
MTSYFEFFLSYVNIQLVLALFAIYILSFHALKRRQNLPPGPWSLPLLGNLPFIAMNLYRTGKEPEYLLTDMVTEYGEVFSLKIGTALIVVANGCTSIQEAFHNRDINDRPGSRILQETDWDEAIGNTSGKSWKYQRTFILNSFRSFGVGRSKFEGNILKEAQTLVDGMRDTKETPFNPHVLVGDCVSNVICSVVFGKRYDHRDPEFQRLIQLVNTNAENLGSGALVLYLPIAKYILPGQYKRVKSDFNEFTIFTQGHIKEHRQKFDKDNMHDIIDVFLNEIELAEKEQGDRVDYIHLKSLTATASFLFLAGTETSSTTLRWALLYITKYPEIQAQVQHELDCVIGRTRMPQCADRALLPYTEAVLLEIQRIRTVLPLGLPHVASQDTKLAGYDIPKGTLVVSNIWAVHNDPDVWTEPEQFKPERFLDEDGRLRHRKELMPFSTGHRVCLGENLAKMEIFLFFTYILHSFVITSGDVEPPSTKGVGGVTFGPKPYRIIAKYRK